MAKIRITSNPYAKLIKYARWSDETETWQDINYNDNPDSKLISDDLTTNFFPFKANRILDVIIDEFSDGTVDILFTGTEDEFNMLRSICEDDKYNSFVTVERDTATLENARDILPDIVDIFRDIDPLITQSVKDKSKIEAEIGKFSEATNESIPICVIGNVSAGKSSFINALIGHEILPSGDEPLTARIYKISPSHYEDRGKIQFQYNEHNVVVRFRGNKQGVDSDLGDHPLIKKIEEVIAPLDEFDLIKSVNRTLVTVNNFENEVLEANVSNLIEIEVPFNSTMYGRGKTDFVIFDTPGSNTASNNKHIQVLKEAMENMTNGLPIFVTEFNTLDSIDNERLYKEIDSLEELDSRFTMVVVNKSDKANLPVEGFTQADEDKILSMAIPKNLYSGGIYFVSSVIGLGAKTKGEFDNEFYEEIFEDTMPRFSNPEHKRYKQLYRYNIMPEQLKKEAIEESEECEDLLLANSGIYCVEQEINNFAAVYSAYNKCIQSEMFLSKVHNIAKIEIDAAKDEREKSKEYRAKMLEQDKQNLVNALEKTTDELRKQYIDEYKEYMNPIYKGLDYRIDSDSLKAKEVELKSKYSEMQDVAEYKADTKISSNALFDSVVLGKKSFSVKKITENYDIWKKKLAQQSEAEQKARDEALDELFADVKEQYVKSNDEIHSVLLSKSTEYWKTKTDRVRNALVELVTGSSALSDTKKRELEAIIVEYEAMKFQENNAEKLEKDKFETKLFSVFAMDPLNINRMKLARTYNAEISKSKEGNYRNIFTSHIDSYEAWIDNLKELLLNNIVEINPTLSAQAEIIKEETQRIQELESRQRKLDQYVSQIHKMMQWR